MRDARPRRGRGRAGLSAFLWSGVVGKAHHVRRDQSPKFRVVSPDPNERFGEGDLMDIGRAVQKERGESRYQRLFRPIFVESIE